jgi:hypothetical protein
MAGDVLARCRETTKTKDITGGLPRVEALRGAEAEGFTVVSEIDGWSPSARTRRASARSR